MSYEALITFITSTVISIIIAIYQLRYRNLGKITFLEEQFIPLFHDIVKSLPGLQVSYLGSNVSESLTLIKGDRIDAHQLARWLRLGALKAVYQGDRNVRSFEIWLTVTWQR